MLLQWTDPAALDLDKIEEHISEENSPTIAVDVVLRIIETVETVLSTHPRAGRIGRVSGTREFVVEGVPFTVIYRQVGSDQLQVIRVLHDAQQWPSAN